MKKISLIVVDDSVVIRHLVGNFLAKDPDIELIATAVNGRIGVEKINQMNPDIVILDIEMPEMNGLEALVEIRKNRPQLPVIMFSSLTTEGAEATLTALNYGANDYVTKEASGFSVQENLQRVGQELIYKIKELVKPKPILSAAIVKKIDAAPAPSASIKQINLVAIGTSTGGPNALKEVIPHIPNDFPVPIVIVQHMPPVFTKALADSLSKNSHITVAEAQDGELIVPGKALIAPGGYHLTVALEGKHYVARLNQESPENYCRPAVDVLFRSVAQHFGAHTLAVVMTGMGQDGMRGCKLIKEHNAQVIVQDETTSVVWGMPGAVANAGLADEILPLQNIGQAIIQRVNRSRKHHGQ
ncbi:chemotaxis response regulator protein-glutamate methylesterase [Legionella lytica]|uniref:Protein-glutamate methylesterase/protein-glutamine glutaminase n=1 Tax=Legionella lytica TaxID=96232 RepID=A0ABW8D9A7_9GAMM